MLQLHQFQHALHTHAPAHGRCRLAAEDFKQAVIAPAAAQRALGTQRVGDEFEHGVAVVVEPAHQARIDAPGHAAAVEQGLDLVQVLERGFAQEAEQLRRLFDHLLHHRVLGVQDAQRVAQQPALGVSVQQLAVLLEVGDQGLAMCLALGRHTQAVEFDTHLAQTELVEQVGHQQHQFGVQRRPLKTQGLGAQLVELAVAAALRALVAEHRTQVIQAASTVIGQVVLDGRAHHARRVLGAQRQLLAVEAVFEGVHLLLDDVGGLTGAAHEQRRRFDDGRADHAVAVARHHVAHRGFQGFPARRFRRQDVVHAFDRVQAVSLVPRFGGA